MWHKKVTRTPFGIKGKTELERTKYYSFEYLEIGETGNLLKKAKKLNRQTKRYGDRTYFVWPVAGTVPMGQLVCGHIGYSMY